MEPNDILAGPIIRRAEPGRVHLWLATRVDAEIRAEVISLGASDGRVGGGTGRSVALGPNLFVHLVEALPDDGTFPLDQAVHGQALVPHAVDPASHRVECGGGGDGGQGRSMSSPRDSPPPPATDLDLAAGVEVAEKM